MAQDVRFNWSCCVGVANMGWQGAAGWNLGRDVPVPTALVSLLEQGHILLGKFFLFQGHFLNYTNLSNVPSVLQEVSFSAFVKRKIIASGKQQNEKNFNYAL